MKALKSGLMKAAGRVVTHSPPLVKLLEKEISKWTGTIFGILEVLLSVAVKDIRFAGMGL